MSGVDYIHVEVWWDTDHDNVVDTLCASEITHSDTTQITVGAYYINFGIIELRWYAVDNAANVEDTHIQEHYVFGTFMNTIFRIH